MEWTHKTGDEIPKTGREEEGRRKTKEKKNPPP